MSHLSDTPTALPAILVVEDDPVVRLDLADALDAGGCRVVDVADADKALAMMRGGLQVAVLVTDVRMPGMLDGLGLAATVRVEFPETKVIFVTATSLTPAAVAEADGYFEKPCDVAAVGRQAAALIASE